MHILLDYRSALRQRTGVGEYVHHLADALLRRLAGTGDQVTLFSSSWKDRLDPDVLPGARRRDLRMPVSLLNLAWHRLEWPPIERLGAAPDVTWSLHPLLLPARRAAQVVTVHDLYFLDRPGDTAREIRRDYPALAAAHVRRADGVIVNSEYTRDQTMARFGIAEDRITVCYPGAPRWPRRTAPSAPGPILHLGTLEPRKNAGALLRGYERLLRTHPAAPPLVFAGRTVVDPQSLLAGLNLPADRVQFRGYVTDVERRRLYDEASMLVVPSTDEGFGMPALEAMTVGLPVVAARRGALPEVVGEAGLLVDADDPAVLAGAMGRVLDDPALRGGLADAGARQAARFNWDGAAARLLEAFRAAVARREARR